GVEAKHPLVALRARGRGRHAAQRELLDRVLVDVLDPAGAEIVREALLGRARAARRAACWPRSWSPSTACAVFSSVKPSGAVKVKPSFGCRKRRPRTNPSLGSSPNTMPSILPK